MKINNENQKDKRRKSNHYEPNSPSHKNKVRERDSITDEDYEEQYSKHKRKNEKQNQA
jgi:hypothetical protein